MKLSDLSTYKVVGAAPPKEDAPTLKPDFLQRTSDVVGSIFPGKKVGEAIGTAAAAGMQAIKGNTGIALDIAATAPKPSQVIGDVAAGAANIAGFKGVGSSGGFLSKALQSAGLGAIIGGGTAAAEGGDIEATAKGAGAGAALGAGASVATSATGAALRSFRKLPERLIRSATGQSKNEILAGKDISKYVIENKRIGSADQLIKSAQDAIDEADNFINESLASVKDKTVPLADILGDVTDSINAAGGDIDEAGVRAIVEGLAPQAKKTLQAEALSLAEANRLRSQLDKLLGNRAFINAQLPYNKGILMDVTNAIREQVKGNAPSGVREAFDTLSKEMKLRDLVTAKVAGSSRNQIIGLGDLISGGVGGTLGGLPGVAVGAGIKRAAESTLAKTATASIVTKLDRTLSPVLESIEPGTRTAIVNALVQAFTDQGTESQ